MRRMLISALAAVLVFTAAHSSGQNVAPAGSLVSRPAPDFELSTLTGHTVRLSSYRGKVVLVNFWATWCAPCNVEMPWLVELYEKYRSQGIEIIGVNMDDGQRPKVAEFVRRKRVNYTVLLGGEAVASRYGGVRFLPQTFIVGRDGRVISAISGADSKAILEQAIRSALER